MRHNLVSSSLLSLGLIAPAFSQSPPNIIFIVLDDQNDWMGGFDGNLQAITPHVEAFCNEGSMIFYNAHCTAPVSGPSRSALLSGFRPERSGCYKNAQNMLHSELIQKYATLPEYFSKNGYITISSGKIFHEHKTVSGKDNGQWAFDIWRSATGNDEPQRDKLTSRSEGIFNGCKLDDQKYTGRFGADFTWGPTISSKEETKDYKTSKWFAQQLQNDFDKPFFMAVGISKPHLPWFVPEEYFDLYNLDSVKIPDYKIDDLDDILTPSGKRKFEPSDDFLWVQQDEKLFKSAIQAYLASTTYVDECLGVIFNALKSSKYYDNTIVVIFGDHGWHLGEKLRFRKTTGWSEVTRVPLIIRMPNMSKKLVCNRTVNLIDLFPTLIDLTGLPEREIIDGRSFTALLKNPKKKWSFPSMTTLTDGSFSLNDERWRYIRYTDDTEELYDMKKDPMEWTNLINSKDKKAIKAKENLEKWIPSSISPDLPITPVEDLKATKEFRELKSLK